MMDMALDEMKNGPNSALRKTRAASYDDAKCVLAPPKLVKKTTSFQFDDDVSSSEEFMAVPPPVLKKSFDEDSIVPPPPLLKKKTTTFKFGNAANDADCCIPPPLLKKITTTFGLDKKHPPTDDDDSDDNSLSLMEQDDEIIPLPKPVSPTRNKKPMRRLAGSIALKPSTGSLEDSYSCLSVDFSDKFAAEGNASKLNLLAAATAAASGCSFTSTSVDPAMPPDLLRAITVKEMELPPIQTWFFDKWLPNLNKMTMSFTLSLPQDFEAQEMEDALEELMDSHDMLRAHFCEEHLKVLGVGQAELSFVDMRETQVPDAELERMSDSIAIEEGLLWRAVLHSGNKLFLVFHQLIFDELSAWIVVDWIVALLSRKSLRQEPCSFQRYLQYVNDYGETHGLAHAPFWEQMVSSPHHEKLQRADSTQRSAFSLSLDDSNLLVDETKGETTIRLLAALARALTALLGEDQASIGYSCLGRFGNEVDVMNTIGMFYCQRPLLLNGAGDVASALQHTYRLLTSMPEQGIAYLAQVKQGTVPAVSPQVAFGYHDVEMWKAFDLDDGWSFAPFRRADPNELMTASRQTSLSVFGIKEYDSGCIKINVLSHLTPDVHATFCKKLERTLQETVDYLRVTGAREASLAMSMSSHTSPSAQRRSRKSRKSGTNGDKSSSKRAKGKSIRPSRILRNYQRHSIAEYPHIFFIHPGGNVSSTAYESLALRFSEAKFNPKGIDNNVLTSLRDYKMAKDIHKLAKFYVKDLIVPSLATDAHDVPIYLLGWCLGGKICLEAAHILERQGRSKVVVLLLDTQLEQTPQDLARSPYCSSDEEDCGGGDSRQQLENNMAASRRLSDKSHMGSQSEIALSEQHLSGRLKKSKVILFKAGRDGDSEEAPQSFDNGGLTQWVRRLTIVHLQDYNHNTILEAHDEILQAVPGVTTGASESSIPTGSSVLSRSGEDSLLL